MAFNALDIGKNCPIGHWKVERSFFELILDVVKIRAKNLHQETSTAHTVKQNCQ